MATEIKSVYFEQKNIEELRRFLEANKDSYLEIWVVLSNKNKESL